MRIQYECRVEKLGLNFHEIRDDKEYWKNEDEYEKSKGGKFVRLRLVRQIDSPELGLYKLKEYGLKNAPQGAMRVREELSAYITSQFRASSADGIFPEEIAQNSDVYEGLKKTIVVNKYERSSMARGRCIDFHGCICKVCGFDFEKVYGEVGRGFIHVHHISPLHSIGSEYKVNFQTDLIPVCPNCHAMLHRGIDGEYLTIEQLASITSDGKDADS
jgi:5-methylcytosine-specific restriction enzyme A